MAETFQQFADDLAAIDPQAPVRERSPGPLQTEGLQRYTLTGEEIPLDKDTGAPFATRFRMSLVSDEPTKKAIASEAFANAKVEAVRVRGEPQFVVRDYKDPDTGQIKDLLIDEKSASWKDLADLGEVGMQLLGAYLALRGRGLSKSLGEAPGLGRILTDTALANVGAQGLTGATEAVERSRVDQPVRPGEILARRSVEAATGAALDLGLAGTIKGGTKLLNMRRGIPTTAEAVGAGAARNRLAEETKIYVPFSLGEATGSQALRERELLLRKHILGGGRLEREKGVQTGRIREMQEALPGTYGVPGELPSKDVVGAEAVSALRSLLIGAEEGTARARAGAVAEATQDLGQAMTTATGIADRQVLQDTAGDTARQVINLKHDVLGEIEGDLKSQAKALGADKPFIITGDAKSKIEAIIRKSYGREGSDEYLKTTPGSVLNILEDAQNLAETSTWDAVLNVRNSANRLIKQGKILGDTDTGVLKQITETLTEAVTVNATKFLPKEAAEAVKRANRFYSEGIKKFQVKGITNILGDPTQVELGPFEIFRQAANDPDQYFRLKEALTKPLMLEGQVADAASASAGESAWNVFKQGMWDEMTDNSTKAANRALLDSTKLLNKIEALPTRVREDLLGPMGDTALRSLKRLEVLDNPKLPAAEALDILRQGGDTAPDAILQLARREEALDKLYGNQVIKKFAKGDIGEEAIDSDQFVDRFAFSGSIADVRDALNRIEMTSPDKTKLIRSKMIESILESSARTPLDDIVSARKLAKEIGSQETQERLKVVLGEPGTRRLNDFLKMIAYLQPEKEGSISMGGSMAGGEAKANLLTIVRAVRTLPAQVQYRAAAMLISNPNLYRMATGPVQPLNPAKLIRKVIITDDALLVLGAETVRSILVTGEESVRQPTQAEFEQQLQQK